MADGGLQFRYVRHVIHFTEQAWFAKNEEIPTQDYLGTNFLPGLKNVMFGFH